MAPLLDSAERLGVLSFRTQDEVSDQVLTQSEAMANLVAEIIANKSDYGDVIVRILSPVPSGAPGSTSR